MVSEIEIYLVLFTAFAVPSIMAFVSYVKRGSTIEAKEAIADLVIKALQKEIEELKQDVKEIAHSLNELVSFKTRLMTIEERMHLVDILDKDLSVIKLRIDSIDEQVKTIYRMVAGDQK